MRFFLTPIAGLPASQACLMPKVSLGLTLTALAMVAGSLIPSSAGAEETLVRVNTFPTARSLPFG